MFYMIVHHLNAFPTRRHENMKVTKAVLSSNLIFNYVNLNVWTRICIAQSQLPAKRLHALMWTYLSVYFWKNVLKTCLIKLYSIYLQLTYKCNAFQTLIFALNWNTHEYLHFLLVLRAALRSCNFSTKSSATCACFRYHHMNLLQYCTNLSNINISNINKRK